jgi:Rad51
MDTGLSILYGAEIPAELIFKPITQLAGRGRWVYVIDGENSFRAYLIARYAREMKLEPRRTLDHVRVSRAFTCYQLTELAIKLNQMEIGQCSGIVCLGLLGTFYDEDVTLPEAQRLLQQVIKCLKALAERLPIIITVRPPVSSGQDRSRLLAVLLQQANFVRLLDHDRPDERPRQIPLMLQSGRSNGPH